MQLTRRVFARGAVAAGVVVLSLGAASSPCVAQSQGITLNEVLELQRRGVSTRQIIRSAGEYCLGFNLTDSAQRVLRSGGGDDQLLDGLRSACSVAPPEPLPGTLLDVQFSHDSGSGGFTSPDRLCTASFASTGLSFVNLRPRGGCIVSFPTDSLASTVRLELTVLGLGRRASGSVIFGFGHPAASAPYYAVEIGAERNLALCLYTRSSCERVVYQQMVAAIRDQADSSNRLQVVVRGREIELRVNDRLVAAYTAPTPVSGHLLLGVGPSTSVVFTRLLVRDLTAERTTANVRH